MQLQSLTKGRLTDGGNPAHGQYDLRFRLYDAPTDGMMLGSEVLVDDIDVLEGLFTALIDFGDGVFNGEERWLAIEVRSGSSAGGYDTLTPRQRVGSAPAAQFASEVGTNSGPLVLTANGGANAHDGKGGLRNSYSFCEHTGRPF